MINGNRCYGKPRISGGGSRRSGKVRFFGIAAAAMLALGILCCAVGCSSDTGGSASQSQGADSGQISVYSREDGSGTRGAFIELFGVEQKDASGEKVDMTTPDAAITNSTSVMMTTVAGDPNAIGYISLGSLNDTVKAVEIDGTAPSVAAVKDGSYKIARPFNIVVRENLSAPTQDFIDFIMSADGQAIVEDNGYVSVTDPASALAYASSGATGKVVIAGSSSVTPVMEKLAEAYKILNPGVTVEVQQSDSSTGITMATEGTCDIGMASRELKESEAAGGVSSQVIAQDGIAVIVSPDCVVDGLTSDQVKGIYIGEIANWSEV